MNCPVDCPIGYKPNDRELIIVLPHHRLFTKKVNHGDAVQITADVIDDGEGKSSLNSPVRITGLLADDEVLEITGASQGSVDNLVKFFRSNPGGHCNFFWAHALELSDDLVVVLGY